MCHTGGKAEVLGLKTKLEEAKKEVTGWMVIPTACDELTRYALADNVEAISEADAILALTCAFGVQTVSLYTARLVYPGLNTLFVGLEESPGHFVEVCQQCGDCLLAKTAGHMPPGQVRQEPPKWAMRWLSRW